MRGKPKVPLWFLAALAYWQPPSDAQANRAIQETYHKVRSSNRYGVVNFERGPQSQKLNYTPDLQSRVTNLTLNLPNGDLQLPDRFGVTSYRHYAINGRSASWVKQCLFAGTGLSIRNVTVVFPEATQKTLTSYSVAEVSNQVYRTKSRLARVPTSRSSRTPPAPASRVAVTSSMFSASFLVCYAEIEGPPLARATTNSDRVNVISALLRRNAARNFFHVETVATAAGYFAISLSGNFSFPAGEHVFE